MRWPIFFYLIVLGSPLAWLFARALVQDEMFVYRDAAHYYHPLYQFVAGQWSAGRVPLWNPYDNLGEPLLGDASAAVFYPGKLILALPLGFDTNYKLYIAGHIAFCAMSAFAAARGFRRSASGAAIGALSYAYSGSVLFQYSNVVYLVGAAWLPLALLAVDRTLVRRSWKAAMALGCTLAMMVLGGDPQIAYHVGLIAVLYWAFLRCARPPAAPLSSGLSAQFRRIALRQFLLLVAAGSTAVLLAAVQILPSAEWTRDTTRASFEAPRNLYELAANIASSECSSATDLAFLLGQTRPGHHDDSYHFSTAPWHLATLVWPNGLGQPFPTNTRWINALPAEGGAWTPTLYLGLLPLSLAISQFQLRLPGRKKVLQASSRRQALRAPLWPTWLVRSSLGRRRSSIRKIWFSWIVLFALLASFGWYGLGWIVGEILLIGGAAGPVESPLGAPFGGVYWLMQTLLPGYVLFRYPAKWLVVAAIGISLLAACGWDRAIGRCSALRANQSQAKATMALVRRILWIILVGSMALECFALAAVTLSPWWGRLAEHVPPDPLFGPLDRQRAAWVIVGALGHAVVVSMLLLWTLQPNRAGRWSLLLLLLTAVEVSVAQRDLAPTVPAEQWRTPLPLAAAMQASRARPEGISVLPPIRVWRLAAPLPATWKDLPSVDRLAASQHWDRQTLLPRYHLPAELNLLGAHGSMRSQRLDDFWRHHQSCPVAGRKAPADAALRQLGVEFIIAPVGTSVAGASAVEGARVAADSAAMQLLRLENASPRAWIARSRESLGPAPAKEASCRFSRYEPALVELHVWLDRPGLLVMTDLANPGWRCVISEHRQGSKREVSIQPVSGVLRGVPLPAGEHRVRFYYRPTSFIVGIAVSGAAWAGVAVLGLAAACRHAARRPAHFNHQRGPLPISRPSNPGDT